jgi:20S proteasome alpha/beta subunit
MTIVVTVRVNDGIVLAGDSATSFVDAGGQVVKVYNNANKIFNLIKGKPIGAMTFGSGSIGKASIATLSKDLRVRFTNDIPPSPYHVDLMGYSLEEIAIKARQFFYDECFLTEYPNGQPNYGMGYRICGYSANAPLPEAWEFFIGPNGCDPPTRLYDPDSFGLRWAGETEALDRLILGVGSKAAEAFVQMGVQEPDAAQIVADLSKHLFAPLYLPAMPIQDAIDLAQFLAETAARFSQFSLRAPTIGGPIEVATITKHEGFKWVSRKHYYSTDFNRTDAQHVA